MQNLEQITKIYTLSGFSNNLDDNIVKTVSTQLKKLCVTERRAH